MKRDEETPVAREDRPWPETITRREGQSGERLYLVSKRLLDLAVTLPLLVFLAPLMLVIGALIRLESRGPGVFVQDRVGSRRRFENGRTVWRIRKFRCYKFRTMVAGADPSLHRAFIHAFAAGGPAAEGSACASFKLTGDPRVTRVGRILRKTSLDELPQLINVLKGDMSLVGPRPVPDYEVAEYTPPDFERLAATPGMTGPWQVRARSRVSFDEMIRMDVEYVRTQSLQLDLKILVSTVPAVLSGRGAA